jgi:hypothetical protein
MSKNNFGPSFRW